MTKDDLKSFKISEQAKTPVERAKAKKEKDEVSQASVGFPPHRGSGRGRPA